MTKEQRKTRIVFMGTPDFAVHILDAMLNEGMNIVGVISVPDKPAGRGKKLQMSAIKKYALEHQLRVLTPLKLKDPDFLNQLKELKPDLQVVVAFRMLPEVVWSLPPLGTFNLHASLLPQYRGAAPINHAIINGERKTGVTTFLLDHQIDTGRILMQKECEIETHESAGDLHDKLMELGARLVIETVKKLENKDIQPQSQDLFSRDIVLKEAPKIFKEDCKISWNQPSEIIYNFVRGMSPYPAAHTFLLEQDKEESKMLKIFKLETTMVKSIKEAGSIWSDGKKEIWVSTLDYNLKIIELQLQGKKRLKTADFLRGFAITDSMRLIED
jgi:methionyl-tRNA formyltransferase